MAINPHDIDFMTALCKMSVSAGRLLMQHHNVEGVAHESKADKSPVTQADRDAETYLTKELQALAPTIQIIGEEACEIALPDHIAPHFFLIDPLDGTRDFIVGGKDFTVNIGLISGTKPIAGVIYAPAHEVLYFSGQADAYRMALAPDTTDFTLAAATALRTSPTPEKVKVLASRVHRSKETEAFIETLDVEDFVPASSSYKFCLLADGTADIYPRHGRTMEWDTAAGHAIVNAAGGAVTRTDGSCFDYGKLAEGLANPSFIATAHKDWHNNIQEETKTNDSPHKDN